MSANVFKFKRGTTAQVNAYLPALGEPVYNTTTKRLTIGDGVVFGGADLSGVGSADKLTTPRNIALSGTVTGTVAFDGSADVTISTSVGSSLQSSLDAKAPLASPALTGTPTVPTAAVDTNTTQAASTAFVVGQAGTVTPLINGTAAAGSSLRYSRADHIHPTDTTRAPLASPSFTGVPTAPTPTVGTNTTQIATTAMIQSEIANKRAWTNYTPTITPTSGTFTSISATGRYMVMFGICFVQMTVTVTTKGTGTFPMASLPFAALSGAADMNMVARDGATGTMGYGLITGGLSSVYIAGYNASDLSNTGAIIYINGSYPIA